MQAEASGNVELAIVHYRCALQRRSTLDEARYRLAATLYDAGLYAEAREHLRTVLHRDPRHLQARVLLAQVLTAESEDVEAGRMLESAARLTDDNPVLLRRAARAYERGGDEAAALRLQREADRGDPPRDRRDLRPLRPSRR